MIKILSTVSLVLLFCISIFSQTKSINEAQNEIKDFVNSKSYSIYYDKTRYVTKAEVIFDVLEEKTPLAKKFKEFKFKITSLFAIDGIDQKPVRTTLCINTRSKKFFFSSSRNLTLILNSAQINLGEGDRSTKIKGRKIRETLCWEIDKEFVQDLGKTSSFKYEVGSVTGNLKSDKLNYFVDYSKLIFIPKTK